MCVSDDRVWALVYLLTSILKDLLKSKKLMFPVVVVLEKRHCFGNFKRKRRKGVEVVSIRCGVNRV